MSNRVKIYHVVRQFTPSIGGMEDVVANLASAQRDSKTYIPTIITLDRIFRETGQYLPPFEVINGIEVIRLPYWGSERYPICLAVLKAIKSADFVHVHGVDFFFDFLAVTYPIHRKKLVASTHGGFFHTKFASRFKKIYFNSITRITSKAYKKIIATSNNDGEIFSSICKKSLLKTIENGVNVDKFENLGHLELTPTIIYFGRWSQNKGLIETIDLFSELKKIQPDIPWKLIVIGREYDISTADIRLRASSQGIHDDVLIANKPTNEEMSSYIAQASYFICLSHHEGFGIAPIEAMSAGLIPVLSDIPPFRNLTEVTGGGLLLSERDSTKGARAVGALHEKLSSDRPSARLERTKLINESKRYSWKIVAERYADEYSSILIK